MALSQHRHSLAVFALAIAFACVALPMRASGAELCSAEPNTLLFDCDVLCGATAKTRQPCMRSNASCEIECFPAALQQDKVTKTNYFAFLIPFSASTAAAANSSANGNASANGSDASGATITLSSLFAAKSNDELRKITQLRVPATTVGAVFRGGSALNETVKDSVATVEFVPDFLAKSRQVTSLELINLNLTGVVAAGNKFLDKLASSKLNKLSLSNGLLTEFPMAVLKIKSLRTLVLSYNNIVQLNDSIKSNTLAHLDLTANGIAAIPKKTILAGIKGLVLSKNAITAVPVESARIGLLELHLNENKITKYEATNKDLVYLDLSSNQLTEVPTTIGFHRKLKNLVLSGNQFTTFPTNWSFPSLQTLEVVGNQLTAFEAKLTSLTKLDLSGNKLKTVPPVIFTMTKLKTLLLANNSMQDVTFTTDQAKFLVKLEQFAFDTSTRRSDCTAAQQTKIHNFTYCVVDPPASKKAKTIHVHHHKRNHHHSHAKKHQQHHHHKHHDDEGDHDDDSILETSESEPAASHVADEPTQAIEPQPSQETTTALAADGTDDSEPDVVAIGLASAAVGFLAVALPVVLVVLLRRQRRRAAATKPNEPTGVEEDESGDEAAGSDSDDEATMVVSV